MISERNSLSIGLFVIVGLVFIFSVWLWFSSSKSTNYNVFEIVFNEPVNGISIDSPVKYNGVDIGKVKSIKLDEHNLHNVVILVNIKKEVRINKKSIATMKPLGITGMSFIDLSLSNDAIVGDNLEIHNSEPYPVISSKLSLLYSVSQKAQALTDNLIRISDKADLVLDTENIKHLSKTLSNMDTISTNIARNDKNISEIINNFKDISNNLNVATNKLSGLVTDYESLSGNINLLVNNANDVVVVAKKDIVPSVSSTLLPNLNETIYNLNQSSKYLTGLIDMLKNEPDSIFRGPYLGSPGPGE